MNKTTDAGKKLFVDIFNEVIRRPSNKTLIEKNLCTPELQTYLANAEKSFNFKWTPETLDDFMNDWLLEIERLGLLQGGSIPTEETMDKMRKFADRYIVRLSTQINDPKTIEMVDKFTEIMQELEANGKSIITSDGKEHKGFKMYDPKNPIKIESANKTEEQMVLAKDMNRADADRLDNDDDSNIYDFKLRDYARKFCITAGSNMIEQFQMKAETFRRRLELIDTAKPYRFENGFLPLLIQHNNNDFGYRRMPRDNMWIEVGLKFDNVFVCGVHLAKVYVDTKQSGFGTNMFRFYDEIVPNSYKNIGVSVFVVGIENQTTTFYYHFILEHSDIELKKFTGKYAYACPYCSMPMKMLEPKKHYCDKESCVKAFQDGCKIIYDMNDQTVKDQMRLFEMKSIWKTEDKIRQFATNLLDFLTNKKVQVMVNFSEEELVERNKKRAKRGKSTLFPVSIIKVDGTLKEYVSFISRKFNGNYKLARRETPVDGHFYRFKDRDVWTRLYAWIKGYETDEAIRERLSKLQRRDEKGMVLPDEEQYEWDGFYKLIKVWKLPFYRFKGEGDQRPRIDVIDVSGVDKK